jgi:hypothetical protein
VADHRRSGDRVGGVLTIGVGSHGGRVNRGVHGRVNGTGRLLRVVDGGAQGLRRVHDRRALDWRLRVVDRSRVLRNLGVLRLLGLLRVLRLLGRLGVLGILRVLGLLGVLGHLGGLNGDGADGGLLSGGNSGVHGAVGRAVTNLRAARHNGADVGSSHSAGAPGVRGLMVLLARVNPVPVTAAGVIAIINDDIVGRVPGVEALATRLLGRSGAKEVQVNVNAQGQVDVKVQEGVGSAGHDGHSNSGGLHCESEKWFFGPLGRCASEWLELEKGVKEWE